jgi:hypothetical protein
MRVAEEMQYGEFDDLPVVTRPRPQDRRPPASQQRQEAQDQELTFTWDGEEWTFKPSDATGLEFLAALEDEQIVRALRLLLGREQAARLIQGRKVQDLEGFFVAAGEVAGSGTL